MSLFKRKPKIIKGRGFNDYFAHYGKGYMNCKNEVVTNKKNLKPNHRYYEIDGSYYQIDHSRWIKNILITLGCVSLATTIYLPIHFLVIAPKERYHDYNFQYWNECESLNKLKTFVRETVTPDSKYYVPQEDRIATFDMDGTLFGERSKIYIEWLMYQDYLDNYYKGDRYTDSVTYETSSGETRTRTLQQTYELIEDFKNDIENPNLEMDEAHCGAKVFANIPVLDYEEYVDDYLSKPATIFNNLVYRDMFYKPMIEVVEFLKQNNFDIYIVSGTDRFMVRIIVRQHLDIPWNKVIGMDVSLKLDGEGNIVRGDQLIYKNVKDVKAQLIAQEIGNWSILSFGNSSGDIQMHGVALSNPYYHSLAFMNLADDNVRERGYDEATIEERRTNWTNKGYQIFSMKNDWKTIYGDNVTLKK